MAIDEKGRFVKPQYQELRELIKYIDSDLQKYFKKNDYWVQYSRTNCASFYCIKEHKKSRMGGIEINSPNVAFTLYRSHHYDWKKPK